MAYINRHYAQRRSAGRAELLYLLVVLLAGVATAWWAGQKLGMDLSSITTVAAVLGLTESTGITHPVGHASAPAAVQSDAAPSAPYCEAGQTPTFGDKLAALKQRLGETMGSPTECAHPSAAVSDTIQQTTTGLAEYNQLTDTASFTDGWRHWASTPGGDVAWEGTDSDPPGD
jgi:hypothetical protein